MKPRRFAIVLTCAAFVMVAGCTSAQETGAATGGTGEEGERVGPVDLSNATEYTVDPERLVKGCPSPDCIPSIDDPSFVDAEAASSWMDPGESVIGVTIDGESRAYPFSILNRHEIVNDDLNGKPIAVTYCPLCRSGFVYDRRVADRTVTFGVSGMLLDANLVMYDRQTGSLWSQLQGKAIIGPLTSSKLSLVTSEITEWRSWRSSNPGTSVLSRETGIYPPESYDSNPYSGYASSDRVGFGVDEVDERLQRKDLVYGVTVNGSAVAFPVRRIEEGAVVTEIVGGKTVAAVRQPGSDELSVFDANGTANLRAGEDGLVGADGAWKWDGQGRDGSAALERLPAHGVYWFAWSKFNPDTSIVPSS